MQILRIILKNTPVLKLLENRDTLTIFKRIQSRILTHTRLVLQICYHVLGEGAAAWTTPSISAHIGRGKTRSKARQHWLRNYFAIFRSSQKLWPPWTKMTFLIFSRMANSTQGKAPLFRELLSRARPGGAVIRPPPLSFFADSEKPPNLP